MEGLTGFIMFILCIFRCKCVCVCVNMCISAYVCTSTYDVCTSAYVCTFMWNLKCDSSDVIHLTFENIFIPLFVCVVVHVTLHMCVVMHVTWHMCGGLRTACSLSSFSHMGPGIKLRSSALQQICLYLLCPLTGPDSVLRQGLLLA